jgi:hypothetical protein
MQRIDSNDGLFHDGDPFNGVSGTMVTADWLTSQQEELANVVEAAGIVLDPNDNGQLLAALAILITAAVPDQARQFFMSQT